MFCGCWGYFAGAYFFFQILLVFSSFLLKPQSKFLYRDASRDTSALKRKSLGVCVGGKFAGAIIFADDIVLLSTSPSQLLMMMEETDSFLSERGLVLNHEKTQLIHHPARGSSHSSPEPLSFGSVLLAMLSCPPRAHCLSRC